MRAQWFARRQVKERTKLGLQRARANGRIGGGRYKLSPAQQAEAIKMIRLGEKSQAEIAELFNVDRSTISRMMKGSAGKGTGFSDKEEHRRDAYDTLDSATFVPQERTAVSQFAYGCDWTKSANDIPGA